ncbi:MAG: hypothetical protein JSU08_17620 [Acidobacteria bacterium]|nr:hypothetical protein [Acidobacteriota bacterium]
MSVDKITERVRAEFEEMPGLVLTLPQASRFFGLDRETTQSVIEKLVRSGDVKKTDDGALVRASR